jgi:hypothetical protein
MRELCASSSQAEFTAEMIIHFAGLENLDRSGVWVFPKVLVGLDCGSARFATPEDAFGRPGTRLLEWR